jgi:polynucleotide 5'-kinase involved in rRNA processing
VISTETLITGGVLAATTVGHIFVANYRINQGEKKDDELEDAIKDVWKWKNSHEKEAVEMREKYQIQLSELKGALMVTGEQFKAIMLALEDIKDRITALEDRKNNHI